MNEFHRNLNRMALFTALILCGIIMFYRSFFAIATSNIYINGIIIGTTIYGIILCFIKIFQLLPEYRWLNTYTNGGRRVGRPPRLLQSVSLLLRNRPQKMDGNTLRSILDMVLVRFEDDRESVRYITNTLIFLGLLGTFWGLILTVGGFAELIGNLNLNDDTVLESMQSGLSRPLGGMATAFTSSLLGLAGSLVIGFLGLQVQLAQSAVFRKIEEFLSRHTDVALNNLASEVLPKIQTDTKQINQTLQNLDKRFHPGA
ncbi:MAG: hypothetical protein K6B71_02085 [Alphaproteobacteria bacterium]|nr:hypothetical protein [Alphaproteobacteria bacterium]